MRNDGPLPIPYRLLRRIHTQYRHFVIAAFALAGIALHLILRHGLDTESIVGGLHRRRITGPCGDRPAGC